MIVATFYADCDLPEAPQRKQAGFDWHGALRLLERSVRETLGCPTIVFTDERTQLYMPATRVGDARRDGVMLWLLDAQAAAIGASSGKLIMISPDTLVAGPLGVLFGAWDVCLLTRTRPKPIVNSVIAVRASTRVAATWTRLARRARALPPASREWGADVDAVVEAFAVRPREDDAREVDGVSVRLLPVDGIFASAARPQPERLPVPIWDFKGARKAWMPDYARLLLNEPIAA